MMPFSNTYCSGEAPVFPRIREILDGSGGRLRVSVDALPTGAVMLLEQPGASGAPRVMLDAYGTELLAGYIMSARLASGSDLPDEFMDGLYASRFQLVHDAASAILITQGAGQEFAIEARYWDKLYAELAMVLAHTRDLSRRHPARVH